MKGEVSAPSGKRKKKKDSGVVERVGREKEGKQNEKKKLGVSGNASRKPSWRKGFNKKKLNRTKGSRSL